MVIYIVSSYILDIIFDLKFSEKQISRFATKSEGESTTHKAKLKKVLLRVIFTF